MSGLLDTSVVVVLGSLDPSQLPEVPMISAVTLAELSVGPLVASNDLERARRMVVLQQAEADFVPLPFDDKCARAFGLVAASLRAAGKKRTARAYDALIAATAIANTLPLYTANPNDFVDIEGLTVVAVSPQ